MVWDPNLIREIQIFHVDLNFLLESFNIRFRIRVGPNFSWNPLLKVKISLGILHNPSGLGSGPQEGDLDIYVDMDFLLESF